MNDSLIERIHKYRDALRTGDPDRQLINPDDDLKLLDDILEALKPVEDAEVREVLRCLYDTSNCGIDLAGKAANLIKRLMRQLEVE